MKYTPHQCMTAWMIDKAQEFKRNNPMPSFDAAGMAMKTFNELDNFGLIDALQHGRKLLVLDAITK